MQGGMYGAVFEYKPPYSGSPIMITDGTGNFAPLWIALK
jgi:hypothetical protein